MRKNRGSSTVARGSVARGTWLTFLARSIEDDTTHCALIRAAQVKGEPIAAHTGGIAIRFKSLHRRGFMDSKPLPTPVPATQLRCLPWCVDPLNRFILKPARKG